MIHPRATTMASFQPASHLFERNISLNDLDSALDVREIVRRDVVVPEDVTKHRYLDSSTKYSFVLTSFQDFTIEFRKFVYSFLVDGYILRELEAARRLNWCSSLGRMVTVNTLGDGNCLMHAASIGMWAVNDRYQTLRKTAYEALLEDVEGTSKLRSIKGEWERRGLVVAFAHLCPLHKNVKVTPPPGVTMQERLKYMLSDIS